MTWFVPWTEEGARCPPTREKYLLTAAKLPLVDKRVDIRTLRLNVGREVYYWARDS